MKKRILVLLGLLVTILMCSFSTTVNASEELLNYENEFTGFQGAYFGNKREMKITKEPDGTNYVFQYETTVEITGKSYAKQYGYELEEGYLIYPYINLGLNDRDEVVTDTSPGNFGELVKFNSDEKKFTISEDLTSTLGKMYQTKGKTIDMEVVGDAEIQYVPIETVTKQRVFQFKPEYGSGLTSYEVSYQDGDLIPVIKFDFTQKMNYNFKLIMTFDLDFYRGVTERHGIRTGYYFHSVNLFRGVINADLTDPVDVKDRIGEQATFKSEVAQSEWVNNYKTPMKEYTTQFSISYDDGATWEKIGEANATEVSVPITPETIGAKIKNTYQVKEGFPVDLTQFDSQVATILAPKYEIQFLENLENEVVENFPDDKELFLGQYLEEVSEPTNEYYTFVGWNTEKDGSGHTYADYLNGEIEVNEDDVVQFYAQWQATYGKLQINFEDESGKPLLAPINIKGKIGDSYLAKAESIKGFVLSQVIGLESGVFKEGLTVVTFVYKQEPEIILEGEVITKYVDESGKEIATRNVTSGKVGESYTTEQKVIPGYDFKEVTGNPTGEYTEGSQTVTYVYSKTNEPEPILEGEVITKYVDESGEEIASRNVTSGKVGESYTTEQKIIPGYDFKEVTGNPVGEYTEGSQMVIYVYSKTNEPEPILEGEVVTKYVDESGVEIASRNVTSGKVGESYTTEQKIIPGYDFKEVIGSQSGVYVEGSQTIIYVYTKVDEPEPILEGEVVTKYVDESGVEIASRNVTSGKVGESYTTEQKAIPGYEFKEVTGNPTGVYAEGSQTVVYVYSISNEPEPILEGEVITKYVDESGEEIASRNVTSGKVGESYTTEQKAIPGYDFKEVTGNPTGVYVEGSQTIVYVYSKVNEPEPILTGEVITKYVDESGKEIASRNVTSGKVGEGYTTEQKIISGYDFKEVTGNPTGAYVEGSQTVVYVYSQKSQPVPEIGTEIPKKPEEKPLVSLTNKQVTPSKNKVSSSKTLPQTDEVSTNLLSYIGIILLAFVLVKYLKRYKNE
ncbi:MucBP domain-containing protein [Vagococcus sp. DIV0080]|uniref:MucBP domain-containing protein n=1 Tax=Candidatus Vagococcus giribetii TaxID=2230876 RepID=A0ABS3HQI1_9ENTE|nr:MucBP domain-containing protein [Vagococcus sp. DIV0080]MBO0475996.1 MucBP domain-containing protein [Vagococcus sp. DIV0080]